MNCTCGTQVHVGLMMTTSLNDYPTRTRTVPVIDIPFYQANAKSWTKGTDPCRGAVHTQNRYFFTQRHPTEPVGDFLTGWCLLNNLNNGKVLRQYSSLHNHFPRPLRKIDYRYPFDLLTYALLFGFPCIQSSHATCINRSCDLHLTFMTVGLHVQDYWMKYQKNYVNPNYSACFGQVLSKTVGRHSRLLSHLCTIWSIFQRMWQSRVLIRSE